MENPLNISQKAWQYDPATRTVTNDNGREVICTIPAGQPDSIGRMLAVAPAMSALVDTLPPLLENWHANLTTLANNTDEKTASAAIQALMTGQLLGSTPALVAIAHDLHTQLGASLCAWHGEEDSVQEEHSDLIKELEAADARASAVLNAGSAALPAGMLRALAKSLLERAEQLDGLQPYVITHSHRFGQTVYTAWSAGAPNEQQMASLLEEEFEEDRGETLESHRMEIAELTGTAPKSGLAPMGEDADQDGEGADRPAGM